MTQFREGQEVEVEYDDGEGGPRDIRWRRAKIVKLAGAADLPDCGGVNWYEVQFPDGTRGVFDAGHIRAIEETLRIPREELDELDKHVFGD